MDWSFEPTPVAISLRELFPSGQIVHAADILVTRVTELAHDVQPGDLYVGIRGSLHDGADFIDQAIARGAAGLLLEQTADHATLPQCIVPHARAAYSRVCAALSGAPHSLPQVLGVTGTNGKTTTTWLLRSLVAATGARCGVLGTVEYSDGWEREPATLTTPPTACFWQWLQRMGNRGARWAAVELSSHALHQQRVSGLELSAAVVTNVTHDHLDYHDNYDDYWLCKAQIFQLLRRNGVAVVNRDDLGSFQMRSQVPVGCDLLTHSLELSADLTGTEIRLEPSFSQFRLNSPWGSRSCRVPLIGRHNLANALGAMAVLLHAGVDIDAIVEGLQQFAGVPGRLERVDAGQPFEVFVDYAHTDDALQQCLQTLRAVTQERVLCVFGAGGDRDRSKRPKLGAAALMADVAIITSDNPRSEDPADIARHIADGMRTGRNAPCILLDREQAIQQAIAWAQPGDCVLIAGKGHEREQIVGTTRMAFDDVESARRALQRLHVEQPGGSLRNSA